MILYGDSVMYNNRAAQQHFRILMLHRCVNFCIKQTKKKSLITSHSYGIPFSMENIATFKLINSGTKELANRAYQDIGRLLPVS